MTEQMRDRRGVTLKISEDDYFSNCPFQYTDFARRKHTIRWHPLTELSLPKAGDEVN